MGEVFPPASNAYGVGPDRMPPSAANRRKPDPAGGQQVDRSRDRVRRPLPPWTPPLAVAITVVALLADIALRLPFSSLASTLVVIAVVGLLAVSGRLGSMTQRVAAGLAVVAGLLLSIRTSVWVVGMASTAIVALLTLIAGDGLTIGQRRPWLRTFATAIDAAADLPRFLQLGGEAVNERSSVSVGLALRVLAVATVVVTVIGGLLASGDAAFGWLIASFDLASWIGHVLLTVTVAIPAAGYALVAHRAKAVALPSIDGRTGTNDLDSGDSTESRPNVPLRTESLAALWALAGTLLLWCGVQLAVLSGGVRNAVFAEQGLTAADYARNGFFQLVAVAALSLAVVNGAFRLTVRNHIPDRAQRAPAILIGLGLTALIVVSYSRLGYYIGSFGLTMLRLSVATFLAWLALMTAASVARTLGFERRRNLLPSFAVFSAAVFAIVFGFANPEARVAQVNLDRAESGAAVDLVYMTTQLGHDAKGTVGSYAWPELGVRPDSVTTWLCAPPKDTGYGPFGWNWSRSSGPHAGCSD